MTISVTRVTDTLTLVKAILTTATGSASETTTESVDGAIKRVVTVPQGGVAPDANWDVTITDKHGVDLLGGEGANRDTGGTGATEDIIVSDPRVVVGRLTFAIANGGNSKKATVFAYIEKTVAASSSGSKIAAILVNTSSICAYTDTVENNQSTVITNTSSLLANLAVVAGDIDLALTNSSTLVGSNARERYCITKFSLPDNLVQITNASALGTSVTLPRVDLAELPSGATITDAFALFKFRVVGDSSGSVNKLSGAQSIQVKEHDAGSYTNAITFEDDEFRVNASGEAPGDCVVGSLDIASQVAKNASYDFQWTAGLSDGATLDFRTVQSGLCVWYSV